MTLYRWRLLLMSFAIVILVGLSIFGSVLPPAFDTPRVIIANIALVALVGGVLCALYGARWLPTHGSYIVATPVTGRWLALNSPASKVPSHGVRAYGQAHAIDLVYEPKDTIRPQFGTGQAMRPAEQYPAFGQPVYAMLDGTVVGATDWRRDHKARSNMLGVIYMMLEGALREFGGPGFIIGNHVIIKHADGVYSLLAHLQQRSITVQSGDTVRTGDVIGRCGNSGNSSEPHVHAQLMDRRATLLAIGLPMQFTAIHLDDTEELVDGLPANGQHMISLHDAHGYENHAH